MIKKNKILITGGAGFVGTNLIKFLIKKTKYKIISLDNYSSGLKKNHIKNSRVKYINGKTSEISKIIKNPKDVKTYNLNNNFNNNNNLDQQQHYIQNSHQI